VSFISDAQNDLSFEIEFETYSENLAPEGYLTRKLTFRGTFADEKKRVLNGTYEESISGFKDNQGNDIPIILTGNFLMIFSNSGE